MPSNQAGWTSWVTARRRWAKWLLVGVAVGASTAWIIVAERRGAGEKAELLAYQLCVGREKGLCPSDTTFVQNVGEDTVAKWAQKECAGYKARRIVINDGPSKDCDCFLADVRCSSE
jgi:hypothetical protein